MRLIQIGIFLLGCSLFFACGDNAVYEKHIDFKDGEWYYSDSLVFDFEIDDTTQRYNLLMMVRNSDEKYPHRNLYVMTHTRFPSGELLKQELNIVLQDEKGYWLGDCSGDVCELVLPLQQKVRFPEIGKYSLKIEQYMRLNPLPGMISIGFRVEPYEAE